MKRFPLPVVVVILVASVGALFYVARARTTEIATIIDNPRFGEIHVYGAEHTSGELFLIFQGAGGSDKETQEYLMRLARRGNVVAQVDLNRYLSLTRKTEGGVMPCYEYAGEVSRLSQVLQNNLKMERISSAILLGVGDKGSQFAFALHRFLKGDFFGSLALSLPVDRSLDAELCQDDELIRLEGQTSPLTILNNKVWSESFKNFRFLASPTEVSGLTSLRQAVTPAFLECSSSNCPAIDLFVPRRKENHGELPLIELVPKEITSQYFTIFLSGDGGWASIDKEIGSYLRKQGIPVIGFDSLKYFWRAKNPERLAADISSLISTYQERLGKKRVVLLGFSLGADVIPFILTRLPAEQRQAVSMYVLMSAGTRVEFEVHLTDWISDDESDVGLPIAPEVSHIGELPGTCLRGEEEERSLCDQALPPTVSTFSLKGSHHFDGDYKRVAEIIVKEINTRALR